MDGSGFTSSPPSLLKRGRLAHHETASIKALLVKLVERKEHIIELRAFLVKHPLLVLALGFIPQYDKMSYMNLI
jgi:hypothetical protein